MNYRKLDPTANEAIGRVMKEEKRQRNKEECLKKKQHYKEALQHILKNDNCKKVYVLAPFVDNLERSAQYIARCCKYVVDNERVPISSHLMYYSVLNMFNVLEHDVEQRFTNELIALSDEVWLFGNRVTGNMQDEINEAKRLKKRIIYVAEENVNDK